MAIKAENHPDACKPQPTNYSHTMISPKCQLAAGTSPAVGKGCCPFRALIFWKTLDGPASELGTSPAIDD